jgi:hypothetical protein
MAQRKRNSGAIRDLEETAAALGTMSTQNHTAVNIDGGTIDDVTLGGTIAGTPTVSGSWIFTAAQSIQLTTGTTALTLRTNDGGTTGVQLTTQHTSATPAANDVVLAINAQANDSGGATDTVCQLQVRYDDTTAGTEDASFLIRPMRNGARITTVTVADGVLVGSATGGDQGAGTINATGLFDDGSAVLHVASAPTLTGSWTWTTTAAGTAPVTITSTDAGASSGPLLDLHRDSSSSAASDNLAAIRWRGEDAASNATTYTQIGASIADTTDGSEDGTQNFQTMVAGTLAVRMSISNGLFMAGATGGDQGAGTINATGLFDDGVAALTQSSIASQATMETGTSTTEVVCPGRQHNHASASKCWAKVTYSGGTPSAVASYNVSSLTDTGVGQCTVNIGTDFSSANYAAVASVNGTTADLCRISSMVAGSYLVTVVNEDLVGFAETATDESFSTMAFGDQ